MTVRDPRYASASSWELVAACQRGDREAFGLLYKRYAGFVYHYLLGHVRERALAEDLTSDTFMRAWRGIGGVQQRAGDVGAWLVRIAGRLVIDYYRSARYRREAPAAVLGEQESAAYYNHAVIAAARAAGARFSITARMDAGITAAISSIDASAWTGIQSGVPKIMSTRALEIRY